MLVFGWFTGELGQRAACLTPFSPAPYARAMCNRYANPRPLLAKKAIITKAELTYEVCAMKERTHTSERTGSA